MSTTTNNGLYHWHMPEAGTPDDGFGNTEECWQTFHAAMTFIFDWGYHGTETSAHGVTYFVGRTHDHYTATGHC